MFPMKHNAAGDIVHVIFSAQQLDSTLGQKTEVFIPGVQPGVICLARVCTLNHFSVLPLYLYVG